MASVQTDRTGSVNSSSAIKVPCRVATTADLTPSLSQGALNAGGGGLFTIDGVALNAGDRVLVKNQTDQTTNGIWLAATTSWLRDVDAQDNRALVKGTLVLVTDGTLSGGLFFELTTANPITIGSSNITFAVTSNPTIGAAMSPVVGAASLAAARTAMAVPGLGDNNTYSGTQTFNGAVTFNSTEGDSGLITLTGAAINEARTTIASAGTTNIGAAAANYLQVTGTTTITAFDTVQAGTRRILEFAASLILTHNAVSLILPGAQSVTTAAGDVAVMVSEGTGNWRCADYQKATWPAGGGRIAQIVNTETGAVATGTTQWIAAGDTIPTSAAGDQYMSLAITPTNANSTLLVEVDAMFAHTVATANLAMGLFQDATANAVATVGHVQATAANSPILLRLRHKIVGGFTPGTPTTLKMRAGPLAATGGTLTFNGTGGSRLWGGTLASNMTITEILP